MINLYRKWIFFLVWPSLLRWEKLSKQSTSHKIASTRWLFYLTWIALAYKRLIVCAAGDIMHMWAICNDRLEILKSWLNANGIGTLTFCTFLIKRHILISLARVILISFLEFFMLLTRAQRSKRAMEECLWNFFS